MRKKIVRDFAKWTAISALRSGSPLKSGKKIDKLIEMHANLPFLFNRTHPINQNQFDKWHEKAVCAFLENEPALRSRNQVGWAAKIINVYLKTRVYVAKEGRDGLIAAIHPPIDTDLQERLKKEFPRHSWRPMTITSIQSYQGDYIPFIKECRSVADEKRCLPIEVEYYWR
jgi:hypothetical protein